MLLLYATMLKIMKVRAFLVADDIAVIPKGGKLVIEGVFDVIFSEIFPAKHKSLSTILIFDDEKNEFKYRLFLKHKANRIKIAGTEFTKTEKSHRIISRLNDWVIAGEGEYIFEVELNDKLVASYSVIAKIVKKI